jgi:hypothetical protein
MAAGFQRARPESRRRQRSMRKRRTTATQIPSQNRPTSHVAGNDRGRASRHRADFFPFVLNASIQ